MNAMPSLFDVDAPPRARRTDDQACHDAAARVRAGKYDADIFNLLSHRSLTKNEIWGSLMYVRVPCDDCGDVSILVAELHVRFCLENQYTSYWFLCPSCKKRVASSVHDSKRVMLLTHPAISPECWSLPPEESHPGPPLGPVDFLALHADLEAL